MSYEIVKSIVVKDGKVIVRADSNNVYPKDFSPKVSESLTQLLKEKGQEEFDLIILKEFESGNFQSTANNKYTKALKNLYYVFHEEYKKFNWRNSYVYGSEEDKQARALRESDEFKALLKKALNTPLPKQKFIVIKKQNEQIYYVRQTTSRHIFYTYEKSQAKEFDFKQQADIIANQLNNSEVIALWNSF